MTMWLNARPPTPVGAVEPWQLESTARTSTTARAAIERRLVADAMAGIGTFCQCTPAGTQRALIEMLPARALCRASRAARRTARRIGGHRAARDWRGARVPRPPRRAGAVS